MLELSPYQEVGVDFLINTKRAILGDDVGLGKTAQALVASTTVPGPVLVITRKSLVPSWLYEISRWCPHPARVLTTQSSLSFHGFNYVVTNYEVVTRRLPELLGLFQCVIVDEAMAIKNRKAQRTKALHKLPRDVPYVWLLTGTLAENGWHEIWSLLHCIRPDVFRSYWSFIDQFFNWGYNYFGGREIYGLKNPRAFAQAIQPYILRRTKELLNLPPLTSEIIYVPMDKYQQHLYEEIRKNFFAVVDTEKVVTAPTVLAQLTRLRQVTCSPALVGGQDKSAKTDTLIELLKDLTADHKVLVFTTFAEYVKLLLPKLQKFGAVALTGDMSTTARGEAVNKFQNDPSTRVFIGTIQAAGVGLNLQEADTVIFLNKSWVPGENAVQAVGRAYRRGQTKPVSVYSLVMPDSVDEYIEDVLARKLKAVNAVEYIIRHMKGGKFDVA